jgi:histidine ammonia-lyase
MTVSLASLADLTLENLQRVAWRGEGVRLAPEALAHMERERRRFMKLTEDPAVTVYGVTSGYGQHAKKRLTPDERKIHARRPATAMVAAWGDPLPERVVRGIVFARLGNFIAGASAITPAVAEAVAALLDGPALPEVPSRGQGGAGEILALAPAFADVARHAAVGEKDVLSLVNGSPAASALVADAALAAGGRLRIAVQVMALAAEAFNTPLGHFDPALQDLWNNPHDAWALTALRQAIGPGHGGPRRPYQAPVSFRILPRMLGLARRAERLACEVATESLAAVTDNPAMLAPDAAHPLGQVVSTGGYHNPHAVMAMDTVSAASVNLITLAGRLAAKILDGHVSLLPDQLDVGGTEAYLGCLPMAITGFEEEARLLAGATLLPGSESGGFGQNDVASPVVLAWRKQERAGALLEAALAGLAIIAERALVATDRAPPPALADLVADVRAARGDGNGIEAPAHIGRRIETQLRQRVFAGASGEKHAAMAGGEG